MPQQIKTLLQPIYPDPTPSDKELETYLNDGWQIIDTTITQGLSLMRIITLHRSRPPEPPTVKHAEIIHEAIPLTPEQLAEIKNSPSLSTERGLGGEVYTIPQPLPQITYGTPPMQRKSALQIKAHQIKERLATQREADDRAVLAAAQAAFTAHYKPFQYEPLFPQGA